MIEIGQLRRWTNGGDEVGSVFLVIGFTEAADSDDVFVDYIMDGTRCWDEKAWLEYYSEVVSETR